MITKTLIAIALLLAQISCAHSDFQSDRKWVRNNPAEPPIRFLYLGKKPTKACIGASVEACIEKQGAPNKRQLVSANEEHLFYYGKKILYRGTGKKNSTVGPEWREIVVKDGKVVDEFEVVQMIETISVLFPYASGNHYYEGYGSNEIGNESVSVYGDRPMISEPPAVQRMRKPEEGEELITVVNTLVLKPSCDEEIDGFKKDTASSYEKWRNEHAELVKALEEDPPFQEYAEFINNIRGKDLKIMTKACNRLKEAIGVQPLKEYPEEYSAKEIRARVVDADTGEPLDGAVVSVIWGLVDSNNDYTSPPLAKSEVISDHDGWFYIPAWGPKKRPRLRFYGDRSQKIMIYKAGYKRLDLTNARKELFRDQKYLAGLNSDQLALAASNVSVHTDVRPTSPIIESVWNGRTIKLRKFILGEEIKYDDANGRPATRKITEDDLFEQLQNIIKTKNICKEILKERPRFTSNYVRRGHSVDVFFKDIEECAGKEDKK